MGRPKGTKKYTPKGLWDACNAYFDAISYEEPILRKELILNEDGEPELDKYGHPACRFKPVVTKDGKEAVQICWTEPPSMAAMYLWLGIDKSTFARYQDDEKLGPVAAWAKTRVEAYCAGRLDGKNVSGTKFNLQCNFGWGEKDEDRSGPQELVLTFGTKEESPYD